MGRRTRAASLLLLLVSAGCTIDIPPVRNADLTGTWTLTVRNVGAAARSYALVAVDHSWGLPVGSTVTFTPASFTLSPGQSRTVDVALSVDNQIVPNQDYAPSSYEAMPLPSAAAYCIHPS